MSYNLGTASGRILIDGSGAVRGFGVASTAAGAFFNVIESKLDSVDRLGTNLLKLGAAGSAGLGLAVKSAASFEAGLSGVRAVSGATTAEMEKLRAKALQIGKDTSFSATEAVAAISELSKAGVSTTDILTGAADATVALAAAGEIDLPRAAEIASSAINNFALSGKELPHVADLIAGAANASAIDVGDFGFSLSQAGAVANLVGLSFDDLAVAIAEMGQAGIKGSDAGTSIKTFLSNLIPTTAKQTSLFRELGLVTVRAGADMSKMAKLGIKPVSNSYEDITAALSKYVAKQGQGAIGTKKNAQAVMSLGANLGVTGNAFFDAQGKMLPFRDIQDKLADATKNLSKEQKLQALDTLFGSDAIRASAVFANQGAEGFDKMATAIGKVKAADVAKTRLDNLNGSIEELKGSFETMQIIIGEVFLPIIRKFVDALTAMIGIFLNLPEPLQKAIAVFLGLGTVMSLFTGILIKLAFVLVPLLAKFLGFTALKQIFSIFSAGFAVFRSGAGAAATLAAVMGRGGVVFTRFAKVGKILFSVLSKIPGLLFLIRGAVALAFGPWGIALAAIVAGTILAYNKIKPFHDLVDSIATTVKGTLVNAFNFAKLALHAFVGAFQEGDITSDGFIGKMEMLGSKAKFVVDQLKSLVDLFNSNVMPVLRQAGAQIKAALGDSFDRLAVVFRENIIPAFNQLKQAIQENEPAFRALWVQIQPLAIIIGKVLLVAIAILFVTMFKLAQFIIGTLLPIIIKLGTVYLVGLIKFITDIVTALTIFIAVIIRVATAIGSFWVAAIQLMHTSFKAALTVIVGAITAFGGMIVSALQAVGAAAVRVWQIWWGMFGPILTAIAKLWLAVLQLALALIIVAITVPMDWLFKFWSTVWNKFVAVLKAVWGFIAPYVKGAANKVLSDLRAAWSAITAVTSAAWRLFQTYVVNPVRAAAAFVSAKVNEARNAVRAAWNSLVSLTRSAFNSFFSATNSGTNKAMAPIRAIRSKVMGALSGAGSWLVSAGRAIIQGLINGINSATAGVRNVLNNITGMIPDWKGPMETDRKLLTKNGIAIMKSLLAGLGSQVPDLEAMLRGITRSIPAQISVRTAADNQASNTQRVASAQTRMGTIGQTYTTPVTNFTNIYNPVAEKSSLSITKSATRLAAFGVIG